MASLLYSCLGNPMDRGAWQTTVHEVAELDMTEHSPSTRCFCRYCVEAKVYLGVSQSGGGKQMKKHLWPAPRARCLGHCGDAGCEGCSVHGVMAVVGGTWYTVELEHAGVTLVREVLLPCSVSS